MSEFIITSDQMKMLAESVGYFVDEPISEVTIGGETLPDADELRSENAKLRELTAKMAKALRVDSEWCDRECIVVFGCDGTDECPIAKELRELGIEVDEQ